MLQMSKLSAQTHAAVEHIKKLEKWVWSKIVFDDDIVTATVNATTTTTYNSINS